MTNLYELDLSENSGINFGELCKDLVVLQHLQSLNLNAAIEATDDVSELEGLEFLKRLDLSDCKNGN